MYFLCMCLSCFGSLSFHDLWFYVSIVYVLSLVIFLCHASWDFTLPMYSCVFDQSLKWMDFEPPQHSWVLLSPQISKIAILCFGFPFLHCSMVIGSRKKPHDYRAHFVCFYSPRDHSPLFVVQFIFLVVEKVVLIVRSVRLVLIISSKLGEEIQVINF